MSGGDKGGSENVEKIKLKPCPFCGGEGCIRYIAVCELPYFAECDNEYCIAGDSGVSFALEKEAVEAWNKRAGEDSEVE